MVRVFIKGGVWKNSEDEILKAAVMKYGKQQWARVASLLNRKSAKQCKARWFEWLDPSIKKVEWSREEEEKLLHLAKLMPAQWRSIGPLVGRTAAQCQEHYEVLLDSAATAALTDKDGNMNSNLENKKLRPGEIDTHPETKPARPDPIDMDEDEIEMLQEARARLANTQGKKAKRKQREKMLQEAKRLADLQKRRELKQAGLLSSQARIKAKKRQREVDYATEIPFHKPAPSGFHDVSIERQKADNIRAKRLKEIDFKKVNEENYRSRDAEEQAMKKREEQRLKNLERANLQLVIQQTGNKNIEERKRGVLNMPAPMVQDGELRQVAKLASGNNRDMLPPPNVNVNVNANQGAQPTDVLLGDYSDRPLPTPMRTPASTTTASTSLSTREALLKEAANLKTLTEGQTPLLGGESGSYNPSPMIHSSSEGNNVNMTPRVDVGVGKSSRDELGLNMSVNTNNNMQTSSERDDDDAASISTFGTSFSRSGISSAQNNKSAREIAREERRAIQKARMELTAALAAIPAPQYEYELAVPEAPSTDEADALYPNSKSVLMEKDAADVEAEEMRRLQEEAAALYAKRSSVVKRQELPRPVGLLLVDVISAASVDEESHIAKELLQKETLKLMQHDAHAHPYELEDLHAALAQAGESSSSMSTKKKKKSKKKKNPQPPEIPLDHIPSEILDASRELLLQECKGTSLISNINTDIVASNVKASQAGADASLSFDDQGWSSTCTTKDKDDTNDLHRQFTFTAIKAAVGVVQKRADKIAANLSIKNGGYVNRADGMSNEMRSTFQELQHAKIEEYVYRKLMRVEESTLPRRIEKMEEDIQALDESEAVLQRAYGELLLEKNRLVVLAKKRVQM